MKSKTAPKEYFEIMRLLVLYKFGDVGTAESTADEIYNIFNSQELNVERKPMILPAPKTSGNVNSVTPDNNDLIKNALNKDYGSEFGGTMTLFIGFF